MKPEKQQRAPTRKPFVYPRRFRTQYPDRESNSELSFRRALLYPFNYQGISDCGCKGTKKK